MVQGKEENAMAGAIKIALLVCCYMLMAGSPMLYSQIRPAEVRIDNKTERILEIKVMECVKNVQFKRDTIPSGSHITILIPRTGTFYLKVKASYFERAPVYSKLDPFKVEVDSDGYSILSITYNMEEGLSDPNGGTRINEDEFNKN